jgi:hypothetical protein
MSTPRPARPAAAPPRSEADEPRKSWTIRIDGWRPALDNELMHCHWRKKHSLKRRDASQMVRAALAYNVPAATTRRRLTLTIRQATGRFPDDSAPLKSLWDALKRAGLIVDDSRDWLEFVWPPTFERGPKGTIIQLEDIV